METIFKRFFVPLRDDFGKMRTEIGNLHDRIDNIQNLNNEAELNQNIRTNNTEFPTIAQTIRGRQNLRQNQNPRQESQSSSRRLNDRPTSNNNRQNLNRAQTQIRTKNNNINNNKLNYTSKTFAEMVGASKIKPTFIRNIRINAEGDELNKLNTNLLNDYACQDVGIKTTNCKSKDFITIKCKTEEDAKKLEDTLKNKYGPALDINKVKDTDPQFKIIGISLQEMSPT